MPNASAAEIYFIAGMFALIVVISGVATYFFVRTYRREQAQRRKHQAAKQTPPKNRD